MDVHADRLLDAFLVLKDRNEVRAFLTDLLSETELKRLQVRWSVWELLAQGLSQTDVANKTQVSRVVVGRAAKVLRNRTNMVQTILERLNVEGR